VHPHFLKKAHYHGAVFNVLRRRWSCCSRKEMQCLGADFPYCYL